MNNRGALFLALLITAIIFGVELVGGWLSNSLSLLSDAGHMLTDTLALTLALLAAFFAARPATKERTFGFYRLEILSALFNGVVLSLVSLYIFYQAYLRLLAPVVIRSDLMLAVAMIGLLANIGAAVILAKSSRENLNVKGAFLHIISDAVSSVGVIVGGVLIYFLDWYYIDPILGFVIGVMILRGAINLVFESVNILLEAAPAGVNLVEVAAAIKTIQGVEALHDLHIWTITSGRHAISAHVVIAGSEIKRTPAIIKEINGLVKAKYQITHATFQTECESCPDGLLCCVEPVEEGPAHHRHH